MRSLAKDGGILDDFVLLLGHIQAPRFAACLMKGFPVNAHDNRMDYMVHDDSFTYGVCLNHLALRLVRCPNVTHLVKQKKDSHGNIIVPFQIRPKLDYPDRVLYSFPTFEMFWDCFAARAI